jgi:hypothetical protein
MAAAFQPFWSLFLYVPVGLFVARSAQTVLYSKATSRAMVAATIMALIWLPLLPAYSPLDSVASLQFSSSCTLFQPSRNMRG